MSSYTRSTWRKVNKRQYRVYGEAGQGTTFYVGYPGSGRGVYIPEGFLTDGPSMPPWARFVLKLLGVHGWIVECLLKASLVHDFMRESREFTLIESDAYFLIAMEADRKNWRGPRWATALLRDVAFSLVRMNRSRVQHNAVTA